MASKEYLLVYVSTGSIVNSNRRHKLLLEFKEEKKKTHFVPIDDPIVFQECFCFDCSLADIQEEILYISLMNDSGFAHHPVVKASCIFQLSNLAANHTWGPLTMSLIDKSKEEYGRINVLLRYVTPDDYFVSPKVSIDTAIPLFYSFTVQAANLYNDYWEDKGVYLEVYSGDNCIAKTEKCYSVHEWNERLIFPFDKVDRDKPFAVALYYGKDNYIGEILLPFSEVYTIGENSYENIPLSGRRCRPSALSFKSLLIVDGSVLYSPVQSNRAAAQVPAQVIMPVPSQMIMQTPMQVSMQAVTPVPMQTSMQAATQAPMQTSMQAATPAPMQTSMQTPIIQEAQPSPIVMQDSQSPTVPVPAQPRSAVEESTSKKRFVHVSPLPPVPVASSGMWPASNEPSSQANPVPLPVIMKMSSKSVVATPIDVKIRDQPSSKPNQSSSKLTEAEAPPVQEVQAGQPAPPVPPLPSPYQNTLSSHEPAMPPSLGLDRTMPRQFSTMMSLHSNNQTQQPVRLSVTPAQPAPQSPPQPVPQPVPQPIPYSIPQSDPNFTPQPISQPTPSLFPSVVQVASSTSSQLPTCLAIDPITDDTFGDDYDDKRVLAMNPDDAPSIQPITLPLPIVTESTTMPPEPFPQPLPNLLGASLRQEGLRSADGPVVEQTPIVSPGPSILRNPEVVLPSIWKPSKS